MNEKLSAAALLAFASALLLSIVALRGEPLLPSQAVVVRYLTTCTITLPNGQRLAELEVVHTFGNAQEACRIQVRQRFPLLPEGGYFMTFGAGPRAS